VNRRPRVLLSCATSIDGYIDDSTQTRLLLSNAADFDRVDAVRAEHDAILVGAGHTTRQPTTAGPI
jgi:5-amino-6-(5-phosphoribosylamino)uracil reductase